MPDLETRPILPSLVMSAGMMPAFDLPGDATPGQLGPTMRVALPREQAYAQNAKHQRDNIRAPAERLKEQVGAVSAYQPHPVVNTTSGGSGCIE